MSALVPIAIMGALVTIVAFYSIYRERRAAARRPAAKRSARA
jgi:hypothetical protein